MLLIPAIDLRNGRCVRLYQGNFEAETSYTAAPEKLLRHYRALGAPWVHVVDLDGALKGVQGNRSIIADMACERGVYLQVGGGIREASTIRALLDLGVARVVIGSAALERPADVARWLHHFGTKRLCLSFDVRMDDSGHPRVHIKGWLHKTPLTLWDAIDALSPTSFEHVLCTDIERDGTLTGPNVAFYRAALSRYPHLQWQASGGVRHAADLSALEDIGIAAAVSGKALLENHIPIEELRPFWPVALSPVSTSGTAAS